MTDLAEPWGYEAAFTVSECNQALLKDKSNIEAWLIALVEKIDMKAFGKPSIEHFANHSHEATGYTAIQLIETSSIGAHFAENLGKVFINVFSCKHFSEMDTHQISEQFFEGHITQALWTPRY